MDISPMVSKLSMLLDIIACPICKKKLLKREGTLFCKECDKDYEIIDNIPILVRDEEKNLVFDDIDELKEAEVAWENKPLLRKIYHSWYKKIILYVKKDGICIELSAGNGNFSRYYSKCIASDIRLTKYVHFVANATCIPLLDESVNNIVVVDGLHHYNDIWGFFGEASRVLKRGGRLVLVEPYLSVLSNMARKKYHHEDIDWNSYKTTEKALEANLAIPTKLFFKEIDLFKKNCPSLKIIHKKRYEILGYPLSGGFKRKSLVPSYLYHVIRIIEIPFLLFKGLLAFKMMVILEKS